MIKIFRGTQSFELKCSSGDPGIHSRLGSFSYLSSSPSRKYWYSIVKQVVTDSIFSESIMSEGRINKMVDVQETKFLHLFGLALTFISLLFRFCIDDCLLGCSAV
jgi:hypothetical protein